jgi:hypothetical protein
LSLRWLNGKEDESEPCTRLCTGRMHCSSSPSVSVYVHSYTTLLPSVYSRKRFTRQESLTLCVCTYLTAGQYDGEGIGGASYCASDVSGPWVACGFVQRLICVCRNQCKWCMPRDCLMVFHLYCYHTTSCARSFDRVMLALVVCFRSSGIWFSVTTPDYL